MNTSPAHENLAADEIVHEGQSLGAQSAAGYAGVGNFPCQESAMPRRTLLLAALVAAPFFVHIGTTWTAPVPLKKPVKEITNSIGMKLVCIEPGKFMMGSPTDEKDRFEDEGPQHEVEITKPFCMGVYSVTQAE